MANPVDTGKLLLEHLDLNPQSTEEGAGVEDLIEQARSRSSKWRPVALRTEGSGGTRNVAISSE